MKPTNLQVHCSQKKCCQRGKVWFTERLWMSNIWNRSRWMSFCQPGRSQELFISRFFKRKKWRALVQDLSFHPRFLLFRSVPILFRTVSGASRVQWTDADWLSSSQRSQVSGWSIHIDTDIAMAVYRRPASPLHRGRRGSYWILHNWLVSFWCVEI